MNLFLKRNNAANERFDLPSYPIDHVGTRAAFDIGSGKFKLLVADVYGKGRVEEKFSKIIRVDLAKDLAKSSDRTLSESIQKKALTALKELKNDAEAYGATQFQGVATDVFRKAKNGEACLKSLRDQTKIPLKVVSQKEEGMIAFHAALALAPEIEENNMVVWDTGSSSFQIVSKENNQYVVYEGPLGVVTTTKAFLEKVRGISYSEKEPINPITLAESQKLAGIIRDKIVQPAWLKGCLSDSKKTVVCIGDSGSIFSIAAKAIGTNRFTLDQVRSAVQSHMGLSNENLMKFSSSSPQTIMIRLVLLSTVMESFGIHEILFKESSGSTLGILTSPRFWIQEDSKSKLLNFPFFSKRV